MILTYPTLIYLLFAALKPYCSSVPIISLLVQAQKGFFGSLAHFSLCNTYRSSMATRSSSDSRPHLSVTTPYQISKGVLFFSTYNSMLLFSLCRWCSSLCEIRASYTHLSFPFLILSHGVSAENRANA